MKWLHLWRDDGSFTADEKFMSPEKEKVLDDEHLWITYIRAQAILEQARQGIIDNLRDPTEEEVATRKLALIERLKLEGLNPDDYF